MRTLRLSTKDVAQKLVINGLDRHDQAATRYLNEDEFQARDLRARRATHLQRASQISLSFLRRACRAPHDAAFAQP
jgi:hypothetical protein